MDHYTYLVTWSAEEQEYVGLCAEMPLLSHFNETREAALQGILGLVAGVVADMTEKGESPPESLAKPGVQLPMPTVVPGPSVPSFEW